MAAHVLTPEDRRAIVDWLQKNHANYTNQADGLRAALQACVPEERRNLKISSATTSRYYALAGLVQPRKGQNVNSVASPLDVIHNAEQAIRNALLDIDAERNILQSKILELDNLAAKYRKM